MGTSKTYLDKRSLWAVIIAALLILILVTGGVLARIFLDELKARIVLISFIVLVSLLGICTLTYLEVRKRAVQKYNKTLVQKDGGYLYQNINQSTNNFEATAPKDNGWEYSNRATMPAT